MSSRPMPLPVFERPPAPARGRWGVRRAVGHRGPGAWPRWLLAAAALAGGALTALAFPPFELGVAAPAGVVVGLVAMARAGRARRGALAGWLFAVGWYAIVWSWLGRWGALPALALAAGQALFWLPVGAVAAALPRTRPLAWAAGVAGMWTLADAFRARWPLGGWEWGQLGYALHDSPARDAAALAGVLGLTFLTVLFCAAVAACLVAPPVGRRWVSPVAAAGLAVLAVLLGGRAWTEEAGRLDVVVVQVEPPCPGVAAVDCPGEGRALLRGFAAGTANVPHGVDVVVWGEGALGGMSPHHAGRVAVEAVGGLPAPLLAGVTSPAGPGRFHNRNVLFSPDGEVIGTYSKRHLVPFGEFVPARSVVGRFYDVGRLVPRDAVPGREPGLLRLEDLVIGTVSSFEGSVARQVRTVGREAHAIAVLSTVSSYGESPASDQFLAMNQLRAAELQRGVVVAATTGRSTVIAPDGTRGQATELLSADVLRDQLVLRSGATPYARAGDAPAVAVSAGLLVVVGLLARRRR